MKMSIRRQSVLPARVRHTSKALTRSRVRAVGFSLIELLVVVALIAILGGGLYSFYAGKGTGKKGEPKTPMSATMDSVCLQNLGSVRQCIKAEEATDEEKHPAALTDIKALTPELRACPVGKEPYVYDPATGQVHCPHPGHENY